MKIAILGTRGIPNNYGGFEQCAEQLSVQLVEKGYDVTVYSVNNHPYNKKSFKGVRIVKKWCPEHIIGSAAHFVYDFLCLKDALKKHDVIFEFGYQSVAISFLLLSIKKSIIITNMDGLEWKRDKWSPFVKKMTKYFEYIATKKSTALISDNAGIKKYLYEKYNAKSTLIPYGVDEVSPNQSIMQHYKMKPFLYFLLIARLEPENNIEMILNGYVKSKSDIPFLVIGNDKTKYGLSLKNKYKSSGTKFLGSIYNKEHLDSLRHFAKCYFHGHSVGGTNPSLLEAMAETKIHMIISTGMAGEKELDQAVETITKYHQELSILQDLLNDMRDSHERDSRPQEDGLVQVGMVPVQNANAHEHERHAWISVTRALLNLHETITRY